MDVISVFMSIMCGFKGIFSRLGVVAVLRFWYLLSNRF